MKLTIRNAVAISCILFIVGVILLTLAYYHSKEDMFGVYLDKDVYKVGEKAVMTVWNDSPYTITYGYDYGNDYRFQRKIGSEWVEIHKDEETSIYETYDAAEAIVRSSSRRNEVINISWLEAGDYLFIQIIKQHKNQVVTHTFYEEFTIIENN